MVIKKIENAVDESTQYSNSEVQAEIYNHFNWGAFSLSWIWGLGNKTYITLLALVLVFIPFIGNLAALIACIIFGIKGNRWAWQNKQWKSVEHFHKVQKTWACWGIAIMLIPIFAVFMAILLGFAYHQ